MKWADVFKLATKVAAEKRKANPKLTVPQSTKEAFKDPRVKEARAKFEKAKAAKGKSR
jgi:hypothetical protein